MRKIGLLLASLLLVFSSFSATYYSKGSLAAQTAANWNTARDGSGTNATGFATSGDIFVVQGIAGGGPRNDVMTSGSTMTFGAGVTIWVEAGGTLQQNSNITLNATATFRLDAGSNFIQNSSNGTNISSGIEAWNAGATITYTNTGYITTANITGGAHPNVVVNTGSNANFAGAITNIAGDLTMAQAGANSLTLTGATAMTLTISGNLNINSGTTFSLGNGTAAPIVNLAGNLTIASGLTFTYNGSGAQGTLNFTKSGTQIFSNSGTIAATPINYTVNSGSTLNMGTSILTGTGTFNVASGGGIITANTNANGALTTSGANGSVQVTGTRNYNVGGNYNFNGGSAQTAGNGLTGAATLTLNNSAGLTLSANTAVTNTLALTSGKLTLGAFNLILTGASITGASSTNNIITNSNGNVIRSIASGSGFFTFPIARSSSAYNPLTITNTGGSTSIYTVGAANNTYSPSADAANAQWTIASSAATTSTLAFGWTTAGANLAAAPASGKTVQYNGSTWDLRGGTTVAGTPNVTTVTGITNLANPIWTVALVNTPPTVTTTTATNVTTTSADGGGNVTDEGTAAVTEKGVKYGETSPASTYSTSDGTGTGVFNSSLTGLTPNTNYYYRAFATSYTTRYGSEQQFVTLPNPPVMDDATGRAPTSVGFTANWTAPTGQGSEAFTYTVEVSTDNSNDANFTSAIITSASGIASGTLSKLFNTLNPATTYYYRVAAVNVTGSSAYSAISTGVTTLSATAPTGVTTGTAGTITVSGATFIGNNITTDGGDDLTARGLVYNTSSPAETGGTLVPLGGSPVVGNFNQALSTLSANTLYYVKAYATNSINTTYASNEVSFITLAAEPTTASTVTVPTRTDVSLSVNFSSGDGSRRIVVARQGAAVDFVPVDGTFPSGTISDIFTTATDQGSGNKIVYDGTGSSVLVSGLVKNTTYHFAVYEYNNNSANSPNFLATAGTASATTYNPTVAASATLGFGNQVTGTNSASQNYSVSGSELVSDITVTAPANFEISQDDIDFSVNPIVLAKNGSDAVPSTMIYVRYSPSAATGATGNQNLSNAATNATTQNVVVSGTAIATEPTDKGTLSFGAISPSTIVINYTLPGSGYGTNRIIVARAGSAPTGVPTDAFSYAANAAYGTGGTALGDGFVVFNNTGSGSPTVTVTGLAGSTQYYFAVYEYNVGSGTSQNYYTTAATGDATTTDATLTTDYFRSNVATGDWDLVGSWQSSHTGSNPWITATDVPTSAATAVNILNGHNITISVAKTIGATTVNDGGTLTTTGSGALTITSTKTLAVNANGGNGGGTVDYQSTAIPVTTGTLVVNGNYKVNPATAVNNAGMVPTATWGASSFLYILKVPDGPGSGTGNDNLRLPTSMAGTVVWDCNPASGATSTPYYTLISGATTIGKLVVINTGGRPICHSSASTNRNLTVTDLDIQGGDYTVSVTATTSTTTINGNLTISGGTFAGVNTNFSGVSGTGAIVLKGNLTISGGSIGGKLGTNTGTGTFTLNGAAAQTVSASGTYTLTNITAANTHANGISLGSNLVISGALTITSGVFDVSASNYALSVSGNWANSGTFNPRSGTVTFNGTTAISGASTTSFNNLTVSGTLTAPSGTLNVGGDFVNNGTFTHNSGTINFNGNNALQTISGSALTTTFNNIQVNKTSQANILEATSVIALSGGTNPLVLTSGTFKLSSASTIAPFTSNAGATYGSNAGFWNNGGTINAGGYSWTVSGLFRNSLGTTNIGTGAGNSLTYAGTASVITIEGGAVNIAGRLSRDGTTSSATTYTQSGGILTLVTNSSTSGTRAGFDLGAAASTFTMSNGSIVLQKATSATAAAGIGDVFIAATTSNITGGTLQIGNASTSGSPSISINSIAPVWNLTVSSIGTPTAILFSNGLTVKNDVTISASAVLDANNLNLEVDNNWSNAGTFTPGSSTVTFNGTNQTIGGSSGSTFNNLALTNGGTKTFGNSSQIIVSSNLSIASGVMANLGTLTTHTAGTLTLGGLGRVNGTWGSTASTATYQNDSYFDIAAAGIITVGTDTRATPTATLTVTNTPQPYTGAGQSATVGISASSVPGSVANILTGGAATQTNTGTYPVTADFVPTDGTSYTTLTALSAGDFVINPVTEASADFRTKASGNFSSATTWQYFDGAVWQDATQKPGAGNSVLVQSGHALTLDENYTVATGKTFDLEVSGSSLVILPNDVLTVTGSSNFNGQSVLIKSDASGTGAIGTIANFGANLSGADNVTVERHIPNSGRKWRLLGIPVTGPNVRAAFADGKAPNGNAPSGETGGYGTLITGPYANSAGAATGNGFDWWPALNVPTVTASIRQYTNTGTSGNWSTVPNVQAAQAQDAYLLFVRGDRTVTTGSGATNLRATGSIRKGDQSIFIDGTKSHTLTANPYPAPVDFQTIFDNNNTLIKQRFWIWDATLTGANGTGAYKLVLKSGGVWYGIPSPYNPPVNNGDFNRIRVSQGFFVEPATAGAGGSGNLAISETDKSPGLSPNPFDAPVGSGLLFINLNQDNGASGQSLADGAAAEFAAGNTDGITDANDIKKLSNFGENLSLRRSNSLLSVEARPIISDKDTLFLNMGNITVRSYNLQFKALNLQPGLTAILQDNYLGKTATVGTQNNEISTYVFAITSDAASAAADRFRVVFKLDGILPLTLSAAKAYQQNNGVTVAWQTQNENGVKQYEVEKSSDGRSFTKAGTVVAQNSSSANYSWWDANAVIGMNYYRIKMIGADGQVSYSQVLLVNLGTGKGVFSIYPNPVRGRTVSIQLLNMDKGRYQVELYNAIGQQLLNKTIDHGGGSASEEMLLNKTMPGGVYKLVLRDTRGGLQTETIVLQ